MKKKSKYIGFKRMLALCVVGIIFSVVFVIARDNDSRAHIRDYGDHGSGGYYSYDYIAYKPHNPDESINGNEHDFDAEMLYHGEGIHNYNGYNHDYGYSHYYDGHINSPPYYVNQGSQDNNGNGNVPNFPPPSSGGYGSITDINSFESQFNGCCGRPCYCHIEGWEELLNGAMNFIGIAPLSFNLYPTVTVTHPNQIQAHIDYMGENGQRTILLNFDNNTETTTEVTQIRIQGNRSVILDSANANNQVWNQHRPGYRHFMLGLGNATSNSINNIGHLELRNVTLSRDADWVILNPSVISGGVGVQGSTYSPYRRSQLTLNHTNATISNNRGGGFGSTGDGATAGGGVGASYGALVTMYNGNIINNRTPGHGGAIFSNGLSATGYPHRVTITIHNGRISGNTANMGGGGVGMCCNTIVRLHDGVIYNNTALGTSTDFSSAGGGAFHLGIWPANTTNRLFMYGGAIGHADINLGNVTYASGGGVFAPAQDRIFYMYGGAIFHNRAFGTVAVQGGGGVYPAAQGTFVFNGGVIGGRWQGGVLVPAGNRAQRGGGVMLPAGVRLEMRGTPETTVLMSNHAYLHGGGIYVTGATVEYIPSVIMEGGTIGGTASGHGNTAGASGGGIFVGPEADFTMRPGIVNINGTDINTMGNIIGNTAPVGGGINATGGLTLEAGNIIANHAIPNPQGQYGLGGGFHVSSPTADITAFLNFQGSGTINITDNTARLGGGFYWLLGDLNVELNTGPINIRNNSATQDGGGIWIGGVGAMPVTANMSVYNNTATGSGGGVFVGPNAELLMTDATALIGHTNITFGNTAARGGGVHVEGTFTMQAGSIRGNTAIGATGNAGLGGGIHIGAAANVNMEGLGTINIEHNVARLGGGLHWSQGTLSLVAGSPGNINVRHNTATDGGGIWLGSSGAITLSGNLQLYSNTAAFGGGIFLGDTSTLTLIGNAQIYNNTTTQQGGAVFVSTNAHLIMNSPNATIGHSNPALGNVSINGGGVYLQGTFTMHSGNILGNTASSNGGGVYIGGHTAQFNMVGAGTKNISGNTALNGGGVHWGQGTWNVSSGVAISGNTATVNGGGIWITSPTPVTLGNSIEIHGNTAVNGGGIMIDGNTTLTLTGIFHIFNNTATQSGGGVYVPNSATLIINSPTVTIGHTNSTLGNTALRGGGVNIAGTVTMEAGSIRGNSATGVAANTGIGGGINLATPTASMTLTGSHPKYISGNSARYGGGVYYVQGSFTIAHGNTGQVNITGNSASQDGAGIYLSGNMNFAIPTNTNIHTNVATRNGGGLFVSNATLTMAGGNIGGGASFITNPDVSSSTTISPQANRASMGAGVYVGSGATFIMNNSAASILGNYASFGGGGVAVNDDNNNDAIFTFTAGTITGNLTTGNFEDTQPIRASGGGVLVAGANASFTMNGGTISNNSNPNWSGAGVTVMGHADFLMTNGFITGNICRTSGGGGVAVRHYGTFTLDGGTINNNIGIVGAGVLSYNRGLFIMESGLITGNIIRGGTPGNIGGNLGGGGLGVAGNAMAIMRGGTITGHTLRNSLDDGGGVWVAVVRHVVDAGMHMPGISTFIMEGGYITNNSARRGGGIFLDGVGEIENSEITDNTASAIAGAYVAVTGPFHGCGGGIYVTTTGTLEIEETEITGNHASQMGGGIFTELHQYYVSLLSNLLAYSNLTIDDTVLFDDNTAGRGAFTPPTNSYLWTGIPGLAQTGTQSIYSHPINNYDINFRRGTGIPFTFHKANQEVFGNTNFTAIADIQPYLLPGAQFTLFRFVGSGAPPNHAYIGSPLWDVIYNNVPSTGLLATPIVMRLTPEGIYHLEEVFAPVGFQPPMGQWRIVVDANAPGGFAITPLGVTSIPTFTHLDGYFYVGNIPGVSLPVTGGAGVSANMAIGGTAMIFVSVAAVGYLGFVILVKSKEKKE